MISCYEKSQDSPGFSLIELLVYLGLVGVVLIPLISIVNYTVDVRVESAQSENLGRSGLYILDQLTQKVRYSESTSVDEDGDVLTVVRDGDSESFYVREGQLFRSLNSGSETSLVSGNIRVEHFDLVDASISDELPSVRIQLRLVQGENAMAFSTAASRRLQEK